MTNINNYQVTAQCSRYIRNVHRLITLRNFCLLKIPANHILSASFMSAPAALAVAKLFYPETKKSHATAEDTKHMPRGWVTRYWVVLCNLFFLHIGLCKIKLAYWSWLLKKVTCDLIKLMRYGSMLDMVLSETHCWASTWNDCENLSPKVQTTVRVQFLDLPEWTHRFLNHPVQHGVSWQLHDDFLSLRIYIGLYNRLLWQQ